MPDLGVGNALSQSLTSHTLLLIPGLGAITICRATEQNNQVLSCRRTSQLSLALTSLFTSPTGLSTQVLWQSTLK